MTSRHLLLFGAALSSFGSVVPAPTNAQQRTTAYPTSAVEVLAALEDTLPKEYLLLAMDPCAGSWAVPDTTGGEINYTIMRYRGLLMVHVDIPGARSHNAMLRRIGPHTVVFKIGIITTTMQCNGDNNLVDAAWAGQVEHQQFRARRLSAIYP